MTRETAYRNVPGKLVEIATREKLHDDQQLQTTHHWMHESTRVPIGESAQTARAADKVNNLRCLYRREDLPAVLQLRLDQINHLVNTRQLTSILICGEERFDSREVSTLIDTYIRVTRRKANNVEY